MILFFGWTDDAPGTGFPQAAGELPVALHTEIEMLSFGRGPGQGSGARNLNGQPDGTMRAMHNRNQKDEYSIKDGKFTANGEPTPPQHKCRQRMGALRLRA